MVNFLALYYLFTTYLKKNNLLLAADSSSSSPNVVCLLFVRVQVEKLQPNCYLTAT